MNKHYEILNLIRIIRESFPNSVEVYTKGSCIRFALILKTVYPEGEVMYDCDHATFLYGEIYYDITGEITAPNKQSLKIEDYGILQTEKLLKLRYEGKRQANKEV